MSIVQISGGEAPNVIPDSARAVVSLRTGVSPDGLLELVRAAAGARAEIEVISKSDPQSLHTVPGFESAVMPFGSDIPHLKAFGAPLLVGPGSALDAHTAGEKIAKSQLREAVDLYQRLARELGREAEAMDSRPVRADAGRLPHAGHREDAHPPDARPRRPVLHRPGLGGAPFPHAAADPRPRPGKPRRLEARLHAERGIRRASRPDRRKEPLFR